MVDAQGLFAYEAQQRVRVALLQHLRGDVATAAPVPGTPHGACAAAADRIGQLVPAGEDLTHAVPRPPQSLSRSRQLWCDS
jgi:hypothetical protein